MSDFENGQGVDPIASIRRARERAAAAAGGQRDSYGTFIRKASEQQDQPQQQRQRQQPPRMQIVRRAPSSGRRPGPNGLAAATMTSAKSPVWPLGDSLDSPSSAASPYLAPPRQTLPPKRPQRPSQVPSIVETPQSQYYPPSAYASEAEPDYPMQGLQPPPIMMNNSRVSDLSFGQPSFTSSASRGSTISSVGSIPDFPIPVAAAPVAIPEPPQAAAVPPSRRSVTLGPPPSARRGASSFYSTASYVSPIPEESPGSRSNASRSNVPVPVPMPSRWGPSSYLAMSPESSTFYEDIAEDRSETPTSSLGGDASPHGDRMNLVNRTNTIDDDGYSAAYAPRPDASAAPDRSTYRSSLTAGSILKAYDVASSVDPMRTARRASASRNEDQDAAAAAAAVAAQRQTYDRRSALRRPPRLDIDAVRQAEARGSLTSLPDLIRRATRVAEQLGRGKRPASAADDLSMAAGGMYARGAEGNAEKYQSGLSDMLAAFPPPGQQPSSRPRQSLRERIGSWPMPLQYRNGGKENNKDSEYADQGGKGVAQQRKARRCCGMPPWVFLIALLTTLVIVIAAVVIPLEFFVIHKPAAKKLATAAQCSNQITCANGGISVMSSDGQCSCICINNFIGTTCTVAGDNGCSVSNLGPSLSKVTLGKAIPRLLQQAQSNYSIALSATGILGSFNNANLSCGSENALVTFDGASVRQSSSGSTEVFAFNAADVDNLDINGAEVVTVTVTASASASTSVDAGVLRRTDAPATSSLAPTATESSSSFSISPLATLTVTTTVTPGPSSTATTDSLTSTDTMAMDTTPTGTASAAAPVATFTVTEDILDFARVAVLFILQQDSVESAKGAQSALQRFFSNATTAARKQESVTDVARNITLPNGNSVDLVNLHVSTGSTLAGAGASS